jgi:hypothetical protein
LKPPVEPSHPVTNSVADGEPPKGYSCRSVNILAIRKDFSHEPQRTQPDRSTATSRVTRTIVQPEVDAFEEQEARSAAQKSALAARQACEAVAQL